MELRHLRHFVTVVELGNLSKAAEAVHISQPALTRSIQNLEEMLGVELLERKPRGVVATTAGETLYQHATLMLNEAMRATTEVRAVHAGGRGHLAIGIAAMFADHLIDEAVSRICEEAGGISLSVTQGFLEDLLESLRQGRLDLIFSNLGVQSLPGDLKVEPLYDLRAYAYVSASHPLASKATVTKAELLEQRWAVVDQPHMRDFLDRYFSSDGLSQPDYVVRTNSLNLIKSLISSSTCVSVLPEHLMSSLVERGEVVQLTAPGCPITRRAGILTRKSMPVRPLLEKFCAELRTACARAGEPQLQAVQLAEFQIVRPA